MDAVISDLRFEPRDRGNRHRRADLATQASNPESPVELDELAAITCPSPPTSIVSSMVADAI